LAQIPMYTGYNGAASVYVCCITCKVHTSGKIFILVSGFINQGM